MAQRKIKGLLYTLAIALAALAGAIAFILIFNGLHRNAKARAAKDPLGIELAGMVPCGSDILYDATGKKIGRYECEYPDGPGGIPYPSAMRRDFVFRIPKATETILCLPPQLTFSESGEPPATNTHGEDQELQQACLRWQSGTTVTAAMWLRRSAIPPSASTQHLDVTFRYFMGRPGPAEVTLRGPFTLKGIYTDPKAPQYKVRLEPAGSARNNGRPERPKFIRLAVEADRAGTPQPVLAVYDAQGRRAIPVCEGGGVVGHRTKLIQFADWALTGVGLRVTALRRPSAYSYSMSFRLTGTGPEEISAITINERPHERTFRNIPLSPQGGAEADHMAYLDELADRLWKPRELMRNINIQFNNPKTIVAAIDLLRGRHLENAVQELTSSIRDPKTIAEADLERIRRTAARAARSSNEITRRAGALLGLWGGWPEALGPALEVLRRPPERIGLGSLFSDSRIDTSTLLRMINSRFLLHPTPEVIDQITQGMIASEDGENRGWLIEHIAAKPDDPLAARALRQMVECDAPWVWVDVLGYENWGNSKALDAAAAWGELSRRALARAVACGRTKGIPASAELDAEANAILSGLLTKELVENVNNGFHCLPRVVKQIGRRLPKEEALRSFTGFLREAPARALAVDTSTYEDYQRAVTAIVEEFVRLGELPSGDPRWSQEAMDKRNWPEIIREVEGVLKSGRGPGAPRAEGESTTKTQAER